MSSGALGPPSISIGVLKSSYQETDTFTLYKVHYPDKCKRFKKGLSFKQSLKVKLTFGGGNRQKVSNETVVFGTFSDFSVPLGVPGACTRVDSPPTAGAFSFNRCSHSTDSGLPAGKCNRFKKEDFTSCQKAFNRR